MLTFESSVPHEWRNGPAVCDSPSARERLVQRQRVQEDRFVKRCGELK